MTVFLLFFWLLPSLLTYKVESSSSFGGAVHVLVNSWRCLIPLVVRLAIFFNTSDIFLGGEKHDFNKRNQLADYQPNVDHLHVRGGWQVGLSEIGAEGQKVQKSKLVTFFLL